MQPATGREGADRSGQGRSLCGVEGAQRPSGFLAALHRAPRALGGHRLYARLRGGGPPCGSLHARATVRRAPCGGRMRGRHAQQQRAGDAGAGRGGRHLCQWIIYPGGSVTYYDRNGEDTI